MIAISCPKLILIPFRLKLNSLKNKYYEEKKMLKLFHQKQKITLKSL